MLPIPSSYKSAQVEEIRKVDYQKIASEALQFSKDQKLQPSTIDRVKICAMFIDCQLTFCHPHFELPVIGAMDDINRSCEFIYRNIDVISKIVFTMDTHTAQQIFHSVFFVDADGNNPPPYTQISLDDLTSGKWMVNPAVASGFGGGFTGLEQHVLHYAKALADGGKYALSIWPYHAMIGGIGHALVPNIEEAGFFHTIARGMNMTPEIKGGNPLTENYSVLRPEVMTTTNGRSIAQRNVKFIDRLLSYDVIIIGGQAKSHCVAWTIDDLLSEITKLDPTLTKKVYLLEDCTSPVKVPDGNGGFVIDYTKQADESFKRFADAGMHVVKSTTPIREWPGMPTL